MHSKRAADEFEQGRVVWTLDGLPIDSTQSEALDECAVLGCSNPRRKDANPLVDSGFCAERHGRTLAPPTSAFDDKRATTFDVESIKTVFDVAIGSLDFTSGFLDDEEVMALRGLAAQLGVDPMLATPDNFKCKYSGKHELYGERGRSVTESKTCRLCKKVVD